MRNVILGFFAGVVVTLLAVRFVPDVKQGDAERMGQSLRDARSFEQYGTEPDPSRGQDESAFPSADSSGLDDGRAATERTQDAASLASANSTADLGPSAAFSTRAANQQAGTARPGVAEGLPSAPASADTFEIPVAPELMSAFLDPKSQHYSPASAENRRELESQDRDASWSTYLEAQIAAYLFSNEELLTQFSIPSIHCRLTICEVQAIGYGPGAYAVWVEATAGAPGQPWFEFTGAGGPVRQQDGQTLILWYLTNENKEQRGRALPDGARS